MKCLRNQFFSGATLARDQNRTVRGTDNLDHFEKFLHAGALPDQVAQTMDLAEFPPQVGVLFAEAAALECVKDDDLELLDKVLSLEDVVEGSHLQSLDRRIGAGK